MTQAITSTAQWTLAIHRVSETSAEVWVGTLFPTLRKPKAAMVELADANGNIIATINITDNDWQRPFRLLNQRFYRVVTFTNLKPDTHYQLIFSRKIDAHSNIIKEDWQTVKTGEFDTLPKRIPPVGSPAFTIGLGSCFYNHRDGGSAAAAFNALYHHGDEQDKPNIFFLTGDQVYLDIGLDSSSLVEDEIRQRIADDYALHWQALGSILSHGGTWMLPDDHEYWNDYPFYDSNIPTLLALKIKKVREAWDKAAHDGVTNVQRCAKVEHFSIGNDLSICLADFRSFRQEHLFITETLFMQVCDWANTLNSPGILVIPQPLIVDKDEGERNLRNYPDQYQRLLVALANSGHDIVLMSGDVHFGRIASTPLGNNGSKLIEVISSPLSNLTYLNGIATSKAKTTPRNFPDAITARANNWQPQPIDYYDKAYLVDSEPGSVFSVYPKARTKEHFMTLAFNRNSKGEIAMAVKAWSIREPSGKKNIPGNAFYRGKKKQFTMNLR